MKAKIFCLFFLIVLEFIVCPQNGWTQDNTIPMIGAYYFDGWSGKNNSQELWAQEAPTHLTEKLYNDYNELPKMALLFSCFAGIGKKIRGRWILKV